jgi:integrase
MPNLKLTETSIRKLKAPDPSGRQTLYWDWDDRPHSEAVRGFGVLVSGRTNTKSYVVQRELHGKTRRVTLGDVAKYEALGRPLEDIRNEAADMLESMRKGIDPKAQRRRDSEANVTLRATLDKYLANQELSAASRRHYRHMVEKWLADWLDRPLRDVTREMVEQRFRKIKTEVAKRGSDNGRFQSEPGAATANATMRALKILWNYASDSAPTLPPNPVKLKRWYKVPARERHVSGDQLPAFYQATSQLANRAMRDYLLLVLFTGLRRDEAAGLRWSDIDFSQRIIRLPAHRTKAQRKLDLPMSDYVHALLVARRALGYENQYVFPGNGRTGHLSNPKDALHKVAEACGVRVTTHDLRRTFVTVASQCRIPPMALAGLVNHSPGKSITAGYSQISTADLSDAMQIVTDRMKQLCGVPAVEGEGVVPLRA